MFIGLDKGDIVKNWEKLAILIEKPLSKTGANKHYTPDDVLWKCVREEWQCWASISDDVDCVFITHIDAFPTGFRRFSIYLVGGEKIEDWLQQAWLIFKAYAKHNDCTEIAGYGRKGWLRALKAVEDNEFEQHLTFTVEI